MSKAKEVANHIFKVYPKQDKAYITADNRGFLEEAKADAYAQRLKNRKVTVIDRKGEAQEFEAAQLGAETIEDTTAAVGSSPVKELEVKTEQVNPETEDAPETDIEEVPLADLNKTQLQELAKDLDVPKKANKATLIAAIEAAREDNNKKEE